MNENFDIDVLMGKKVKDKVTGFTGLVTGKLESLYGCTQYVVTAPMDKEGKVTDNKVVVDEGRIKIIGNGIRPKQLKAKSGKKGAGNVPESIGKVI